MTISRIAAACLCLVSLILTVPVPGTCELSGFVEAEGRAFFEDPPYDRQERDNASIAIQPEYYRELAEGASVIFAPFLRLDSSDGERSHFDLRELNYLYSSRRWELRMGIGKVFWGTTESQHLVDIINQTDLVEHPDGEEKLGQPMVQLSIPEEWGVVEAFVLPLFRERTFPGEDGRLRGPLVVDTDAARYESDAKERHVDVALRYSNTAGPIDFGVSYFRGTGRDPTLITEMGDDGELVLIPFYEIIEQVCLDSLLVQGAWSWKIEAIYRLGQGDRDFYAHTLGFEYSRPALLGSKTDIGFLAEWLYDERGDDATTPFEQDIMLGLRLAPNDLAGTEVLMGIIQDLDGRGSILNIESSRRLGDRIRMLLDVFLILDSEEGEDIHYIQRDDFVMLKVRYYF